VGPVRIKTVQAGGALQCLSGGIPGAIRNPPRSDWQAPGGRDLMTRIMLSYTAFWVRLGYRIWPGTAHWFLWIVPMPPVLRDHLAEVVALIPYLWVVWGFTLAFDLTWRAHVVAGVITAELLLLVHRVEVARAAR
jgi:hypothetical protein